MTREIKLSAAYVLLIFLSQMPLSAQLAPAGKHFKAGEQIHMNISFGGWFKLGEAIAHHNVITTADGETKYSVDLRAKTVGFLSFVKNVEAIFSSQLRPEDYKPLYSEEHLIEGQSDWDQTNFFDYEKSKVDISVITNRGNTQFRTYKVDLNDQTFDIMGTYMYLRNLDWPKLAVGDSVMINTLFEKHTYDFGVESAGYEEIEFDGKTYNAFKIYVLFPISKTFPEEKAVTFWVINLDGVYLPVLVEAKMRIGRVLCKIESYTPPES